MKVLWILYVLLSPEDGYQKRGEFVSEMECKNEGRIITYVYKNKHFCKKQEVTLVNGQE